MGILLALLSPLVGFTLNRVYTHWKSTVRGVGLSVVAVAVVQFLKDEGCDLAAVDWVALMPALQGALSVDAQKAPTPPAQYGLDDEGHPRAQ